MNNLGLFPDNYIGRRCFLNTHFSGFLAILGRWKPVSLSVSPPSFLNPLLFWINAPKSNPFLERYYHRKLAINGYFGGLKMWCFSKIFALKKGVFRAFWILLALYNCLQIAPDSSLYVLIFKSYNEQSGAISRQLYRATMFPEHSFFWMIVALKGRL